MKLIGLTGPKQVGKDTFANFIKDRLGLQYKVITYAFARPLKEVCKTLFLLTDEQLHDPILKEQIDPRWNKTPRQLFQFVGTDFVRNQLDPNFWIKHFEYWYTSLSMETKENAIVIVTDIRFQNEMQIVHDYGGLIVRIQRQQPGRGDEQDCHVSETETDHIPYDFLIQNNSTLEDYSFAITQLVDTQILKQSM